MTVGKSKTHGFPNYYQTYALRYFKVFIIFQNLPRVKSLRVEPKSFLSRTMNFQNFHQLAMKTKFVFDEKVAVWKK